MADSKNPAEPTTPNKPPSRHIVSLTIRSAGKDVKAQDDQGNDYPASGANDTEKSSGYKPPHFPCDHVKHRIGHMARKKGLKKAYRPKGAASSDSSDDDILTSPDSKLVNADLVSILSNQTTWELFNEDDKAEIRTLVPAHIPTDSEGLPTKEWLKYNPDWQQALRLFQADLKAGHEDPKWKLEAAKAAEERAEGKFDDWKEREFEEYWGQKAKPPVGGNTKAKGGKAKVNKPAMVSADAGGVGGNVSAPVTRSTKSRVDGDSTSTPVSAKAGGSEVDVFAPIPGSAVEAFDTSKQPEAEVNDLA